MDEGVFPFVMSGLVLGFAGGFIMGVLIARDPSPDPYTSQCHSHDGMVLQLEERRICIGNDTLKQIDKMRGEVVQ